MINCLYSYGQLSYYSNGVNYELTQKKQTLYALVSFDNYHSSSRDMSISSSQSRLKSAELMGLYLSFTNAYPLEQQNSEIFTLYVQYYGKGFKADISDIKSRRLGSSDQVLFEYSCPLNKYHITDLSASSYPSAAEMSRQHYIQEKTPEAAEILLKYGEISPSEYLLMISGMLSRNYAPLPVIAKVYNVHPGSIFETSLFYPENINPSILLEIKAENAVAEPLVKRLLLIDLITAGPGKEEKDMAYDEFLSLLDPQNMLWDNILVFAAKYRNSNARSNDLFEAIQGYPGALNMHLFHGVNSELYKQAIIQFNNNQPDSALISLQESVNFNGLTKEKIGLAAALYRLQEDYEHCLLFSTFHAFAGIETSYLPGNLYLSLKNLGFKHTDDLKTHLLTDIQCDAWSMDIIKKY